MYDVAINYQSDESLQSFAKGLGLVDQSDEFVGYTTDCEAFVVFGVVTKTPSVFTDDGAIITDATYYDGKWAILRAEDNFIAKATALVVDGITIVSDPASVPPTGWPWIDKPTGPTLAQAQAARIAEAKSACDTVLAPLAARFSEYERQTWGAQLSEAKALLADPTLTAASHPTIAGIIAVTGEAAADFAAAVLKNDEDWTLTSANVIGQRQAIVAKIKDCDTVAAVLAVDVSITLPA